MDIAQDAIGWQVSHGAEQWRLAWYPPTDRPQGTAHGSSAVCWAGDQVVLISSDGHRWGLPGGRPEAGEDWLDVLKREVQEEACATVTGQRLLGYSQGICVHGEQAGLVLVRAWWTATVELQPWRPQHEITHRKLRPAQAVYSSIWIEQGHAPIYRRILAEAGIDPGK